jgi:hypothetical protein
MKNDEIMNERKERIYQYIKSEDYLPLKRHELCVILDVPVEESEQFEDIISQLISEGKVIETKKVKLCFPKSLIWFQVFLQAMLKALVL